MKDVSYLYPDGYEALREINLEISYRERIAVLGANGAGKSTLLMLINGLFMPKTGSVKVLGTTVNESSLRSIKSHVGFVFQDPDSQLFCPTLWEDVCYGPQNLGLTDEEVEQRSIDALKAVELENYRDKPPHHLSIGEKKRAAIATVLSMHPRILLLDEPTANLDPRSRKNLVNILSKLYADLELTLIIATHDVNLLPYVSDRIIILNQGKVISEGTLREILSNPEKMLESNLEPPIITQLFNKLENNAPKKKIPLTIEEAVFELNKSK